MQIKPKSTNERTKVRTENKRNDEFNYAFKNIKNKQQKTILNTINKVNRRGAPPHVQTENGSEAITVVASAHIECYGKRNDIKRRCNPNNNGNK